MIHFLIISALTIGSAVAPSVVSSEPVQWQADYGKALAATRADDRPLLVVLDVPNNPKTAAEDDQLKTDGDQAELLASYQLCHIDASTEYGQKVAKVFHADKFPFTAIIDKSGSVVLHKKQGQLTDTEWNKTLATYKAGERSQPVFHSAAFRGETLVNGNVIENSGGTFSYPAANTNIVSPSYCPSCQRNPQQSF